MSRRFAAGSWDLRYYFDTYRAQLKVGMALMLQYRFAVLIWGVWGFVGPLVSLAVWTAAAAARGGPVSAPGSAEEFARADFAAYFLTFMIFSHLTMSWDAFEFAFRVRSGQLSAQLLKPIHPIHRDAAHNLSFKVVTSSMLLPIWLLLIVLLRPAAPEGWTGLVLAVPALLLAGVMRYVLQYALAALAFWTTRVEAINQLYFTLDAFLSGRVAPLSLLPGALAAFAYYSPFRAMGAFPVELALGRVPAAEILPGFLLQLAWLGVSLLLLKVVWSAGVRQYSAVGA
ncbi:MAG: ABC transporter permease [Armatimonadota bacterium]